jgi:hypothetical protein
MNKFTRDGFYRGKIGEELFWRFLVGVLNEILIETEYFRHCKNIKDVRKFKA